MADEKSEDPAPLFSVTIPESPASFEKLPPNLLLRAEGAWHATHTLLEAIRCWTDWVHMPISQGGFPRADEIAIAGANAIEVLTRLSVKSPAFQPVDDPDAANPARWWPGPPSKNPNMWSEPWDVRQMDAELLMLNSCLAPELRKLNGVLASSPVAALFLKNDANELLLDGPCEPNGFCWKGQRLALQSNPWLLVKTLWNAPNRTANEDTIGNAIYGPNDEWSVESVKANANREFNAAKMPLSVTKSRRQYTLVLPPP